MAVSKERKEYLAEFEREKYDKILLRLPKGYKARIQEHIGDDDSMNAYIKRLIDRDLNS